jgi:hypothetical protein
MAAPAIAVNVTMEIVDCKSMNIFARRVCGRVLVGLKAKRVVKAG